jgi:predicted GH43/DUF377 family glycosyl hydrolase
MIDDKLKAIADKVSISLVTTKTVSFKYEDDEVLIPLRVGAYFADEVAFSTIPLELKKELVEAYGVDSKKVYRRLLNIKLKIGEENGAIKRKY